MQSEELNENIVETIQEEKPKKKRVSKKVDIEKEIKQEIVKPEVKTAKVEVRVATDNSIDFYFEGYGIHMLTDKQYNVGDIVEVLYEGTIGTKGFKIKLK